MTANTTSNLLGSKVSHESEAALLGLMMVNTAVYNDICETVQPFMFSQESYKRVADFIWEKEYTGQAYDISILRQELSRNIIDPLLSSAARRDRALDHADKIKEAWAHNEVTKASEKMQIALLQGVDYTEAKAEFDAAVELVQSSMVSADRKEDIFNEIAGDIKLAQDRRESGELTGVPSGFPSIDNLLNGWPNGAYIVFAGRASMGKTTGMMEFALQAVEAGKNVLYFSLGDATTKQAYKKMSGMKAGIPMKKINGAEKLEKSEFIQLLTAMAFLKASTLKIIDLKDLKSRRSPRAILDRVLSENRELKRENREGCSGQVDIVFCDYVQQMDGDEKTDGATARISSASRGVLTACKRLDIPFIAGAQINRGAEARGGSMRPRMSDLKGSGAIEEDADMVIATYRPEYYNILEDEEGNSLKGVTEWICLKDRINETAGTTWRVHFDKGRYYEESQLMKKGDEVMAQMNQSVNNNLITPTPRRNDDEDLPF